jgi:hypothetical protein
VNNSRKWCLTRKEITHILLARGARFLRPTASFCSFDE